MNKREAQINSDKVIELLKKERIRQGISMTKMAEDIGMSKSSLSYIEHLTQKPALYTVMMIASYLKVSLSKILSLTE